MAGYIGTTPVPQATQHRESFTATGGQTSFATVGYTPQFIDVYLNGVKLAPADFTATNGSDVVLASGATASDILEIVAYTPFEVADQTFTGTTTAANLTVTGAFTSQGIDDNADAVAITIDSSENVGIGTSSPSGASGKTLAINGGSGQTRLALKNTSTGDASGDGFQISIGTDGSAGIEQRENNYMAFLTNASERMRIISDGTLLVGKTTSDSGTVGVEAAQDGHVYVTVNNTLPLYINRQSGDEMLRFASNGATVGKIGVADSGDRIYLAGGGAEGVGIDNGANAFVPTSETGAYKDNHMTLGRSDARFTDLYLSGGVFLGGTGSANKISDYETGTWTPTLNFGGNAVGMTFTTQSGSYVKVGQIVTAQFRIELSNKGSSAGDANFGGLPFTATSVGTLYPAFYGLHHDVNSGSGNTTTNVLPIGQITRANNTWSYYQADSTTQITNAYFHNNSVINGTCTFRVA